MPKSKCTVCKGVVDDSIHSSIECDSCFKWIHFKCSEMSADMFATVTANPGALSWFCSVCKDSGNRPTPGQFQKIITKLNNLESVVGATKLSIDVLKSQQDKLEMELLSLKKNIESNIRSLVQKEVAKVVSDLDLVNKSNAYNLKKFNVFSAELDKLQRTDRRNDVLITGIPTSTLDLLKVIEDISRILKCNVVQSDIISCFRLGGKNKVILLKFYSTAKRDQFMKAYRHVSKEKKLDLLDVIPGLNIKSRIYLSDNLTPLSSQLAFHARQLKKSSRINSYRVMSGGAISITDVKNVVTKFTSVEDFKCMFQLPSSSGDVPHSSREIVGAVDKSSRIPVSNI